MARHLPGKDTDRENGRPNGAQDALGAAHRLRRSYRPGRVGGDCGNGGGDGHCGDRTDACGNSGTYVENPPPAIPCNVCVNRTSTTMKKTTGAAIVTVLVELVNDG